MTIKRLAVFAFLILAWGCTSVIVRPVDRAAQLKHVCIKHNPKVWVDDFLPVLRDGFDRHGISSEVFSKTVASHCEFIVTYTARQHWDLANYMIYAELRLQRQGQQVAFAKYRLRGNGGLSPMKWQGTRAKMDPVIDELLGAY
jgi:hypothetical protein